MSAMWISCAIFESLRVIIQAKLHEGKTDERAMEQMRDYKQGKCEDQKGGHA